MISLFFTLLACVHAGGFYYAGASVGYPMFSCSICNECRSDFRCATQPPLRAPAEHAIVESSDPEVPSNDGSLDIPITPPRANSTLAEVILDELDNLANLTNATMHADNDDLYAQDSVKSDDARVRRYHRNQHNKHNKRNNYDSRNRRIRNNRHGQLDQRRG